MSTRWRRMDLPRKEKTSLDLYCSWLPAQLSQDPLGATAVTLTLQYKVKFGINLTRTSSSRSRGPSSRSLMPKTIFLGEKVHASWALFLVPVMTWSYGVLFA
ncbi:hypothetical protein NDU88_005606 [Pleurodeles waltl]|uniref:Uncharacterized protein n=1 Tax=Pleurodeles waltl TaxID=8319 RepID=A0AAV7QFD0_PLEWA|nr:hypothetical protein NDU88_005606 [Pleurodeles waltl]